MSRINDFIEESINKLKIEKHSLIVLLNSGSSLHGTAHEQSDSDFIGLFYPSLESLVLKENIREIEFKTNKENSNSNLDIDIKLISIYEFFDKLENGDINCIDLLFSLFSEKNIVKNEDLELVNILKKNVNELFIPNYFGMIGFAIKQVSRYTSKGENFNELESIINELEKFNSKTPLKSIINSVDLNKFEKVCLVERNEKTYLSVLGRLFDLHFKQKYILSELKKVKGLYGSRVIKNAKGIDFKAYSHALRTLFEVKEVIETGKINFPLKESSYLKDIKLGKIEDTSELTKEIFELHSEIENFMSNEKALENAHRKIDKNLKNDIILRKYTNK